MKTTTLLTTLILSTFFAIKTTAQDLDKTAALNLINENATALNISINGDDIPKISSAYTDAKRGITYIYIQQTYKDISVFNVVKSCIFKQAVLQYNSGSFIKNIANKAESAIPTIAAIDAVKQAAIHLQLAEPKNLVELENTFTNNKKITFSAAGIAKGNIKTKLVWVSKDDGKTVQLAWNVSIDVLNSADYWNVRINALNGEFIDKDNYTVYEKANTNSTKPAIKKNETSEESSIENKVPYKVMSPPPTVTTATYNVIPYPYENRFVGSIALETDPWLKAGATNNATTYGWHYDGTNNYIYTRGNNVYAYDDSLNKNAPGRAPNSSTASPSLTFNLTPNFTLQPTDPTNRRFATTNLFYWNNIMHDVFYQYGFDEAAGNFQNDNMGRGGLGGDYVHAEAQDGSGTNNANFNTPSDGTSGRMQMYLYNPVNGTIKFDGAIDNGIVSHEYTHGISTRLTGGPALSSCLNNAEEGGEGWSDYIGLMMTTNWATTSLSDGTLIRSHAAYASNQVPGGLGNRKKPYSTDMSIDPHTYDDLTNTTYNGEVHYIGEVWCSALWDMTWNIIKQTGYINPNLYDNNGVGGNVIALDLVIQGMKLQPCQPGFLDARDAILKADSIFYNSKYHCSIWAAFARRGMGYSAIQGSSNSTTDQIPAYDIPTIAMPYITGANAVCAGSSINLTDSLNGGIWSNSNTNLGSIDTITGLYSGISYGLDTIYYYVPNCNNYVGKVIKINDYPTVTPITGNSIICLGSITTFTDTSTINKYEGVYNMKGYALRNGFANQTGSIPHSNITLVTKDKNTVEFKDFQIWADSSGVSVGYPILTVNPTTKAVTITSDTSLYGKGLSVPVYNNPNYNSRYDSITKTFYISFTWNAGVSARLVIDTLVYSTASGSISSWSSSQPTIASISNTGVLNTLNVGVDSVYYNLTDAYGCSNKTGGVVTINALPTVGAITGASSICFGASTTFTDTTNVNKYEGTYSLYSGFSRSDQPTYTGVNNYPCYLVSKSSNTVDVNINSTYGVITSQPFYISGNTSYNYFTGVAPRLNIDASNNITVTAGTPAVGTSVTFTQNTSELAASKYYSNGITGVPKTTGKRTLIAHFRWTSGGIDRIAKDTFICQNCSVFGSVWSSNDTTIAKVTNIGLVSGISSGLDSISYMVTNVYGCINKAITAIKVNPNAVTTTVNLSGCNNVLYNGNTYTTSTIKRDTLRSVQGCDSIYKIATITVNRITPATINVSPSGCNSVVYKGITYTTSTIRRDTTKSIGGCDSVYTVANITITPITPTTQTSNQSACDKFVYKNVTYTTSSVIKDTLKTLSGCDSIYLTINATVNPSISGRIYHPTKSGVRYVQMQVSGTNSSSFLTSSNYSASCLPANSNVTLRPTKNNDTTKANGITGLDLFHLQNHLLSKVKLNSPYKLIAADVDGSKSIGGLDLFYLKKFLLGSITTFPNNRLWAFVDSAYVFPDSTNPFPFKDSISFTNLTSNKTNQTFIGVKLGDLNFDWDPAKARGVATKPVELVYQSQNLYRVQDPIKVSITANNFKDLVAMQYTLHFDNTKYEFVGIENNKLTIDFNEKQATENGNISFVWTDKNADEKTLEDGSELFTLVLKAHRPSSIDHSNNDGLSSMGYGLSLTNDITDIAAWDKDFNQHNIILTQKITNNEQAILNNEGIAVYPNPAKDAVNVSCKGMKEVRIINSLGQEIATGINLGNDAVIINTKNFGRGLYIVKVLTNKGTTKTTKLILE